MERASDSIAWDNEPIAPPRPQHDPDPSSSSSSSSNLVRVLDGKTELEGTSDMFVSYLVTSSGEGGVRRRFQDFVFLRQSLVKDFQASVVPPLPEKHRMEYVVGDRFSIEFIERRTLDLQVFLTRLSKHSKLSKTSLFINFLQSTEWNVYKHKYLAANSHLSSTSSDDGHSNHSTTTTNPGLLDNISDTLLNAFTKLKKPDPRFTLIRSELDSFEEGLTLIERLSSKNKTRLTDLSSDYQDLASSIQGLGYLESGITEPLMRFERSLTDFSCLMKSNSQKINQDFLMKLHGLLSYSQEFKKVLKLRDQKQLDFEELSHYLSNVVTERDRLVGGYGYGLGLTSYFKDKFEGIKHSVTSNSTDLDLSKAARLNKLDGKIKELQEAVLASQQTSQSFNEHVLQEYEIFKQIKKSEMKLLLGDYVKSQIEFQKKVLESWDK
jgi:sorting nexin-4